MTDRPILFSGPMVRALLEGRKTQTRRVLPLQPSDDEIHGYAIGGAVCDPSAFPDRPYVWLNGHDGSPVMPIINPPKVLPGDHLWVREAWRAARSEDFKPPRDIDAGQTIWTEADSQWSRIVSPNEGYVTGRFRQAMHMPRWASRLTLTVTDVRVQRVQDISSADACLEGWHGPEEERAKAAMLGDCDDAAKEWFADLWDSLNEARGYGWDANPWVAAYTFTVARHNIDQEQAA